MDYLLTFMFGYILYPIIKKIYKIVIYKNKKLTTTNLFTYYDEEIYEGDTVEIIDLEGDVYIGKISKDSLDFYITFNHDNKKELLLEYKDWFENTDEYKTRII